MRIKHVTKIAWIAMLLFSFAACRKNKVKCSGDSEKTYAITGFNKVTAGDKLNIYITKGSSFSVKAKGCTESINDLIVSVGGTNNLSIKYRNNNVIHDKSLDIIITMPELQWLDASAASKTIVNGMAGQIVFMRIVLSGAAECTVNGAATEITFNLSGASTFTITGNTSDLVGQLSGASHIHAYGLASKRTEINASGASEAFVTAQDKLYAEASGASIIRYRGNPTQLFTDASGGARIIKD